MFEYRIEFQIHRAAEDGGEFEEIGFGSSGGWSTIDMCAHMLSSAVQNGSWETENGQPDPEDVMAEIAAASADADR